MAKYKATPFYAVNIGESDVKFDWQGEYETDKADEIKALDGLVPTWIKRIDEPEKPENKPEVKEASKPAVKAASKPKASAK